MISYEELDDRATRLLRANGLRVTAQRLLIYRIAAAEHRHVTAEEVRQGVAAQLPNIALPTVYSVLDTFARIGLLHKLSRVGDAAVYDSRVGTPHAHLVCDECGSIADLDVPPYSADAVRAATAAGFHVDDGDLVFHGLCAKCASHARSAA